MEVINQSERPMRMFIKTIAWAALFLLAGCGGTASNQQATGQGKQPVGSLDQTASGQASVQPGKALPPPRDPCAVHLHDDVCPALLIYLAQHANQLPAKLADLRQVPDYEQLDVTCPESHQPYGYEPLGLIIPDDDGRIVVADTKPVHGGIRWAIRVTPQIEGRPPTATVIPLTDEMFSKLRTP